MEERPIGTVTTFKYERGYGFLKDDVTGLDYFFHRTQLPDPDYIPQVGERYYFTITKGKYGKPQANGLEPVKE